VLQLYFISLRKAANLKSLAYLFLVGVFACAPIALGLQFLVSHYFAALPAATYLWAAIEEVAKLTPVFLLLFRTSAGVSASLLDGMLYAAACGAGFGFAEHAMYMIENAAPPPGQGYESISSILFTWLPGGWANGEVWFAGHACVSAIAGLGLGIGRRLFFSLPVRAVVLALFLAWATFLHANFNKPPAVGSGIESTLYDYVNGSGTYIRWFLVAGVVGALIVEEKLVRARLEPERLSGVPPYAQPSGLFSDLSIVIESLGQGWKRIVLVRRVIRHKAELIHARWELLHSPRTKSIALDRIQWLNSALRLCEIPIPAASELRCWPPVRIALLVPSLVVSAYGLWAIFISPTMNHGEAVGIIRSTRSWYIGMLGQILMLVAFCRWVRQRTAHAKAADSGYTIVQLCRGALAWGGAFLCAYAWKRMYDMSQLPYPFSPMMILYPATLASNFNQMVWCLGPHAIPPTIGGGVGPVPPLINSDPPDTEIHAPDPGFGGSSSEGTSGGDNPVTVSPAAPAPPGVSSGDIEKGFGVSPQSPPLGADAPPPDSAPVSGLKSGTAPAASETPTNNAAPGTPAGPDIANQPLGENRGSQ
jgi:RsiW-degrading membrane proteinase PrsW (M82 family)